MMKRLLSISLTVMMVLSLGTAAAYGEEMGTPPSGQPGGRRGQMADGGTPPELPEGAFVGEAPPERPERPELAEGEEPPAPPEGDDGTMGGGRGGRPMGEVGEMPVMVDTDALRETVAALNDSDTETSLSSLLEAYETALASERAAMDNRSGGDAMQAAREAVQDALAALQAALDTLGIELPQLEMEEMLEQQILGING